MDIINVFTLMGGLGLFLYGMHLMGNGLEHAAGNGLKKMLNILTRNKLLGVLVGTGFTAIIQSSSATTVMVVGFVNAGLMKLTQAASVIMGANIGTTVTAQLVALKITEITPPLILVGVIMALFIKRKVWRYAGEALMGLGILFAGLDMMSMALEPLAELQAAKDIIINATHNPFMGILIGMLLTAVIQSSSAVTGIVQIMAYQGLIPLHGAIFITLGSNIGTCVTALIASIGTSRNARRAAIIHILFNTLTVIIFVPLMYLLPIEQWIVNITGEGQIMRQIANVHMVFNIFGVAVFLPLTNFLVNLSIKMVPGEDPLPPQKKLQYVDERILHTPAIAIDQVNREVGRMGIMAKDNLKLSMDAFFERDQVKVQEVLQTEEVINFLNHEITRHLILIGQNDLSREEMRVVASLFHIINDIERIGDHAENMSECATNRIEEKVPFSEAGLEELKDMLDKTMEVLDASLDILKTRDRKKLAGIYEAEENIDDLEKELQQRHVDRLNQGQCSPQSGMIFSDMLSNLERVSDHATNIAFSIIETGGSVHTGTLIDVD